ncbi:MAG: hypothetical protein ABNH53_14325 [Henriciella sp.]|jgi:hypothetical protein
MKIIYIAGFAALALGGCVSSSAEHAGKKATYANETTVQTNEAGEEVICRKKVETGSRLRATKRCATQAEWDAYDDEVKKRMKDMTHARSTKGV